MHSQLPIHTPYQQVLLDALEELGKRGKIVDHEYGRRLVVRRPTRITLENKSSSFRVSRSDMVRLAKAEVIANVHRKKITWRLIIHGN